MTDAKNYVERVASLFSVPLAAIYAKDRTQTYGPVPLEEGEPRRRPVARARQLSIYWIRLQYGWSYPRLGRFFNRDHTTCVHAVQAVKRAIARREPAVTRALETLLAEEGVESARRTLTALAG